jgi:16S rRNA (guanine966-N2)-methyltransferase
MRIIAGKFKGRILTKSNHLKSLRPTTDRNREALFNILSSAKFIKEMSFNLNETNVLDVCCGTGAVAFEALSRGAKSAFLIDKNRDHLEVTKKNSEILKVENSVKIVCADVSKLEKNSIFFDLVFLDPPYEDEVENFLTNLLKNDWIQEKSLLVIESSNVLKSLKIDNLHLLEKRIYGKTIFWFFKKSHNFL